jgi:signal transduction histidine kinase
LKTNLTSQEELRADYPSTPPLSELSEHLIHKLRNPLSAITTAASQLETEKGSPLTDDDLSLVDAILVASERLDGILTRFSIYACPEPIQKDVIDLNALCLAEINHCQSDSPDYQSVTVNLYNDDTLSEFECDPNYVRHIMCAIIRNAFQAIGKNGSITMRTENPGDYVIITVEDNGMGIPRNLYGMIFQPFVTTRPGKAGLGLAIARRMIEAQHGSIRIENRDEGGTIVTIKLPINNKEVQ